MAFTLTLGRRLYPDDLVFLDTRPEIHQFHGAQSRPAINALVREDPGPPQERDIAVLLSRVFPAADIYLNPFRADTAKELTDVLVVSDHVVIFIEAKDSPNTADSLNRSIERKQTAIQKQIVKAIKQLRGGLSYAQCHDTIMVRTGDGPTQVTLSGRQLLGLVVVREMFDHDQADNSKPVFELVEQLELPIMLIDYAGLHAITLNLRAPERFIDAMHNLFAFAVEHGQFPRSVWTGPPLVD